MKGLFMSMFYTPLATVSIFALMSASPALAQSSNAGTQEANINASAASRSADTTGLVRLQPVTATATRQDRKLIDTAANVSSITDDELDRRMDNLIEDVFRYEPGIEVTRQTSGADPFSSTGGIRIRGVGGNRTQILVDGNRTIERITDSTRDIIDSSNIKAVEIVRGPASTVWGSDGLGGIVNFVTKDPEDYLQDGNDFGGSANFNYATVDNALTESLAAAFKVSPKLEALLVYTRRDASEIELSNARTGADAVQNCTRNPEATQCNVFDPLDSKSNNILGKLVWNTSANNKIKLTGEYFVRNTDVQQNSVLGADGANFINSYDRTQEIKRWRLSVDQDWSPDDMFFDTLNWQLTYSPQDVNRNGDRRRTLASTDEEQRLDDQEYGETFLEADIQFTSSFGIGKSNHLVTYGFDGDIVKSDFNRIDTTRNLTQGTETIRRAGGFNFSDAKTIRADTYIQDEISLFNDRLKIIPGIRLAHYSNDPSPDEDYQLVPGAEPQKLSSTTVQMKLGTILKLNETLSLYGQYSEGFKMPTGQQLYQSLNSLPFFALVPNANLQPESVDNFEIGLRGDLGDRGYFSVNGFYADYSDFILNFVEVDPVAYGLSEGDYALTYDNVDELKVYGIEASTGFYINDNFSTRVSLSYQEGKLKEDNIEREYNGALPLKAIAGLRYNNKDLGLDVEFIGTMQAASVNVEDPGFDYTPSGFTVFDLIGSWEVSNGLFLRASVLNILNTRYFPGETKGHTINGSDAVKRVAPIELQTAPGRNFKLGLSYNF
ncbi:MAG: TonB-dependent hemoglobin/transferrin/lactoferrin family receptor [Emcibacteraceae bacterium]|nr:TonB-dependent hemoglobin/transferrin/lactoferrin family receptor [Emcibacteraceae bacterium]